MNVSGQSIEQRVLQYLTNWIPHDVHMFHEPATLTLGISVNVGGTSYFAKLTEEMIAKHGKDAFAIAVTFANCLYNNAPKKLGIVQPKPGELNYASDVLKKNQLANLKSKPKHTVYDDVPSPWANPKHNALADIIKAQEIMKEQQALPQKHKSIGVVDSKNVTVTVGPNLAQTMQGMKALAAEFEKFAKVMGDTYKVMADKLAPVVEQMAEILEEEKLSKSHPKDSVLNHPGLKKMVTCPAKGQKYRNTRCIGKPQELHAQIIHLNDGHRWTREQIADWLDTLDEQPIFYPKIEVESGKAS